MSESSQSVFITEEKLEKNSIPKNESEEMAELFQSVSVEDVKVEPITQEKSEQNSIPENESQEMSEPSPSVSITMENSELNSEPKNKSLEMPESSQSVSITVESSEKNSEPENRSPEILESSQSVTIKVEKTGPESLSGESESTASITSASDDAPISFETGITNQAYVDDEDVAVNKKQGHQRSPSCSLGKDEKV